MSGGQGRRPFVFSVRADADEKIRYEKAAEIAGMKPSTWFRALAEKAAKVLEARRGRK